MTVGRKAAPPAVNRRRLTWSVAAARRRGGPVRARTRGHRGERPRQTTRGRGQVKAGGTLAAPRAVRQATLRGGGPRASTPPLRERRSLLDHPGRGRARVCHGRRRRPLPSRVAARRCVSPSVACRVMFAVARGSRRPSTQRRSALVCGSCCQPLPPPQSSPAPCRNTRLVPRPAASKQPSDAASTTTPVGPTPRPPPRPGRESAHCRALPARHSGACPPTTMAWL